MVFEIFTSELCVIVSGGQELAGVFCQFLPALAHHSMHRMSYSWPQQSYVYSEMVEFLSFRAINVLVDLKLIFIL